MSNVVNVDFITKVVEIEVNDNETESLAAMAAVNAAKRADEKVAVAIDEIDDFTDTKKSELQVYVDNAATSATSATNTANALINFLATKETLTAPAVDPTLTISGAAADAKVVGEKFNSLNDCFVFSPNLYEPDKNVVGLLLASNGVLYPNYTDYITSDYIPVKEGDTIRAQFNAYTGRYDSGQPSSMWSFYTVCYYAEDKTYVSGENNKNIVTVPANAKFMRFSCNVSTLTSCTDVAILNSTSSVIIPYYPYGFIISLKDSKIPISYDEHINELIGGYNDFEIEPRDTTFFYISKNLVNPSTNIDGYLVLQTNGNLSPYENQTATDYISVEENTTYGFSNTDGIMASDLRYAWYDEAKNFLSGGAFNPYSAQTYTITSPATAKFLRVSIMSNNFPIIITKSAVKPLYEPYDHYYVKPQYMPPASIDEPFNLPSTIYATVGFELNIYFENLVEDWTKYHWNVDCSVGTQWERCYKITPTEADVGTYTMTITIERDGAFKTLSTSLVITSASAGSGETASVIVLGDSTTANGVAVAKLHENFANDPMTIETWGTQGTSPNNHEGRSGFSLGKYFTEDTPFYNPSTHAFDASYYFANSGVGVPNWFIINLGVNDMFGCATDQAMESAIETSIGYMDDAIASLQTAEPTMKIGVCITIPPNHSQDAFGKDYACSQTRDRYKRNNVYWVNRLIEEYDNRTNERIYLIPIYTNLDTIYNMGQGNGMEALPVNGRNSNFTYNSPTVNGGVHPGASGYWQIADVYTAFLKAQA